MLAWIRWSIAFKARHWPWMALIASALMLGAAHYFETFEHLMPCILCLRQRVAYWAAGTIAIVGIAGGFTPFRQIVFRLTCLALAVAFGAGVVLAIWHSGCELGVLQCPKACAAGGITSVRPEDIAAMLNGEEVVKVVSCEKPVWWFLGLTMANWNLIVSLLLAGFSLYAAFKARRDCA